MSDESHEFDFSKIGEWSDGLAFRAEREHMVAFAAATNDDLEPHAKGEYAAPVYAVVPAFMTMAATTMAVVPDELKMRILHGEQDIRIVRPIRAGDDLRCRAKVIGIHGRSSGVVVTTFIETSTAQGELVNEQYYPDMARESGTAALADAGIAYDQVQQAYVGYCTGDSCSGHRAV